MSGFLLVCLLVVADDFSKHLQVLYLKKVLFISLPKWNIECVLINNRKKYAMAEKCICGRIKQRLLFNISVCEKNGTKFSFFQIISLIQLLLREFKCIWKNYPIQFPGTFCCYPFPNHCYSVFISLITTKFNDFEFFFYCFSEQLNKNRFIVMKFARIS